MSLLKKLMFIVGADTKKADKKFQGIDNQAKGLATSFKKVGVAIGGAFAVQQIASFGKELIDLYQNQLIAETKISQAIKSTGGSAKLSAQQIKDMASNLQELTGYGDEQILQDVSAQLLTFTNVAGESFRRASALALDLATVIGTDLRSQTIQLGKVLNDPVKNMGALSRAGIQFSKETEKQIKLLASSNQLFKAQTIILDEIEKQYGGQAKAVADSLGGLKQAKADWGDLLEIWGEKLIPVVTEGVRILRTFTEFFSPAEVSKMQKLREENENQLGTFIQLTTQYEILREKTKLTKDEQKLLSDTTKNLNENYGKFLENTNLSTDSLENVKTAFAGARQELEKYMQGRIKQAIVEERLQKIQEIGQKLAESKLNVIRQQAIDERARQTLTFLGSKYETLDQVNEAIRRAGSSEYMKVYLDTLRQQKLALQDEVHAIEEASSDLFDALTKYSPDDPNASGSGGKSGMKIKLLIPKENSVKLKKQLAKIQNDSSNQISKRIANDIQNDLAKVQEYNDALIYSMADTMNEAFGSAWESIFGKANTLLGKFMQNLLSRISNIAFDRLATNIVSTFLPGFGNLFGLFGSPLTAGGGAGTITADRTQKIVIEISGQKFEKAVTKTLPPALNRVQRLRLA
jgi:hypothetical protein